MNIEQFIAEKKGTIVDVRSVEEFNGGNAPGSINIPLQEIPQRVNEFQNFQEPIIVCCASGMRSGQAQQFLSSKGYECYNAGSWVNVRQYQSQAI